jgi:hypothetical protein
MKSYIKTGIVCVSLIAISACSSGCASYMVYNKSQEKVAMRKAMAKGDEKAIRAVQVGDGIGVGIDVSNWEALSEQPLLQLGAALLDAAMIYGGYKGIDSINNGNDKDGNTTTTETTSTTTIHVNGGDGTTTVVAGDGNTTTSNPDNSDNSTTTTSTK